MRGIALKPRKGARIHQRPDDSKRMRAGLSRATQADPGCRDLNTLSFPTWNPDILKAVAEYLLVGYPLEFAKVDEFRRSSSTTPARGTNGNFFK